MAPDDDDSSDHGAGEAMESEMAIAPETDDTPSVSDLEQSPDPPPAKSQPHAMKVDDEHGDPHPASPVDRWWHGRHRRRLGQPYSLISKELG